MTGASELLERCVKQKIPGAAVRVALEGGVYSLTITAHQFIGVDRADREATVYDALSAVPLSLLAKITSIKCVT